MWTTMEALGGWGRAGADGAAEAPCARGKHSATLLGGHVYVLGGRGAGGAVPLRDFWRYCLASGRWERLAARGEPPPALQEHSATAHGGRLYVFGGEAGALSGETPLWIYDSEVQLWRKLAGPGAPQHPARRRGREARGAGPRGRRGHSAHSLPDCLLVYGGYQDLRGSTNELWAFHYESESWQQVRTSAAGPARHRHAAALHDNRLYVHGGQCDLRDCADLWHYDTISRVWTQVRARPAPSARSGHAGLRAGAHLYVFGGEAGGQPTNELWRFHFATEAWERIVQGVQWPAPRTDCRALLVAGERAPDRPPRRRTPPAAAPPAPAAAPAAPPAGFLREISKLSSFHIRRAARCSYSVLAGERDSTESLVRQDGSSMSKSRSAFVIDERQPADGGESPREADTAERARADLARGRVSVPDFADAAKLVYLDSDEEAEMKREMVSFNTNITKLERGRERKPLPKSASVRFPDSADEGELSTSDYASAERVNRLSAASMGFSNPHYLGPDVRRLGAALTPDSGVAGDIELRDLRRERQPLLLLLVGGREPHHPALLHAPLSLWAYRLL